MEKGIVYSVVFVVSLRDGALAFSSLCQCTAMGFFSSRKPDDESFIDITDRDRAEERSVVQVIRSRFVSRSSIRSFSSFYPEFTHGQYGKHKSKSSPEPSFRSTQPSAAQTLSGANTSKSNINGANNTNKLATSTTSFQVVNGSASSTTRNLNHARSPLPSPANSKSKISTSPMPPSPLSPHSKSLSVPASTTSSGNGLNQSKDLPRKPKAATDAVTYVSASFRQRCTEGHLTMTG